MDLNQAKWLTMLVLGVASIFFGMIPVFIAKCLGWVSEPSTGGGNALPLFARYALSGILCFGGGVLMGTGFLHLLPEVHEGWETYLKNNDIDVNLPLGIVVICAGFFLVYFVEEVVHLVVDRYAHNRADASLHRAVSIRGCTVNLEHPSPTAPCDAESNESVSSVVTRSIVCQSLDCDDKEFCREVSVEEHLEAPCCSSSIKQDVSHEDPAMKQQHEEVSGISPASSQPSVKNLSKDRYGTFPNTRDACCSHPHSDQQEPHHLERRSQTLTTTFNINDIHNHNVQSVSIASRHHHHHHHHGLIGSDAGKSFKLHGLFIIIALSLHEILEGMAVGLQNDQKGVFQLFAAIASHKFVISFCVGLELTTSGVKRLIHLIYICTFSLVTPIGIGIGIAMTKNVNERDPDQMLSSLIMQGLACGTILYVAFFEILERERAKSMAGLIQWTLLVMGFLAILGLQCIVVEPTSASDAITTQFNYLNASGKPLASSTSL